MLKLDKIFINFTVAIIRSLIGSPDSVTDAATISRIPDLYDDLVQTLKTFDFLQFSFVLKVLILYSHCYINTNL